MKLSDYVIKFLESKKIDTVFTVSGGGSIFLCDALYKARKIKYIACHHEQAVSYATESYSRIKNKPTIKRSIEANCIAVCRSYIPCQVLNIPVVKVWIAK